MSLQVMPLVGELLAALAREKEKDAIAPSRSASKAPRLGGPSMTMRRMRRVKLPARGGLHLVGEVVPYDQIAQAGPRS